MKKLIIYSLYAIGVLTMVMLAFIPEASGFHVNLSDSVTALASTNFAMAVVAPLYYDRVSGKPVYSNTQLAAGATSNVALSQLPCVCDTGDNKYQVPEFITLRGVSTGVGSVGKITPFDNVAEAVQGSLGTIFFSVVELAFGAGTIAQQDGTNIYGADVIRNITATRILVIDRMEMTGTDVAELASKQLTYVQGSMTGNDNTPLTFNLRVTNQTAVVVLDWNSQANIGRNLMYKSNNGFQYVFSTGAGGVVNIQLHVVGYQYYGV